MVFTLYKDGVLLKTNLLDVYNCFLSYPIGRTLHPSVECQEGVGEEGGGGGTFYPRGRQFALVQNVRGDICTGGPCPTIHPPTTVENIIDAFAAWHPRKMNWLFYK